MKSLSPNSTLSGSGGSPASPSVGCSLESSDIFPQFPWCWVPGYWQASHRGRHCAVCTRNFRFYLKLHGGGKPHPGLQSIEKQAHLSQKLHFPCHQLGSSSAPSSLTNLSLSQKPSEQSQACRLVSFLALQLVVSVGITTGPLGTVRQTR